nr:hypothetical protein [Bacteroidota bacterium]
MKGRPKKTTFNLEEMCIIIKECAASGVAELKFGDLNVSFFDRKEKERAVFDQSSSDYDHPGPEKIEEIISNQEELTESDELNHRDTQMMTMAIEDPSKFEDMLVHDEVEDIPEGDEDASTD